MILMLCSCTKKTESDTAVQTQAAQEAASDQKTSSVESTKADETKAEAKADETGDNAGSAASGVDSYEFRSGEVTISMNQDTSEFLDKLGDPDNYAESPSCAFEGIDKIYSYKGWDLYTYPDGDKDRVNSVYFTDDTVTTPEGIKIGSTVEEVKTTYGDDYTEKFDVYTYTDGESELAIMTTDGKVDSIEYRAVLED